MTTPKTKGFTMIELLLAMTFISILLISIMLLTMQIIHTYDRGTTLRAVEQSGIALSDELKRTINQGSFDNVVYIATGNNNTDRAGNLGGRLCTGTKSYIWNYGKTIRSQPGDARYTGTPNKYLGDESRDLRFVAVNDAGGTLCPAAPAPLPRIDRAHYPVVQELLTGASRNVVVHKFKLSNGLNDIQAITMTLGTNSGDERISGDTRCKVTQGISEFCAVNTFEFTVRPGNSGGGE